LLELGCDRILPMFQHPIANKLPAFILTMHKQHKRPALEFYNYRLGNAQKSRYLSLGKDIGISGATVSRYERGKLDNLDWRSLSLLCFVLKPTDPLTGEALEPANALYIACEHPPYNDPKLYE
jgi:transcriptional regulator with XRE-family HTH domain